MRRRKRNYRRGSVNRKHYKPKGRSRRIKRFGSSRGGYRL
jgi:hypothetical protein